MRKLILLFFFLSLTSISSMAQPHQKDSIIRSFRGLTWSLWGAYQPNEDSVKNTCWQGCVFIRFKINKKHHLINLAYTASTPSFIKEATAKAIAKINRYGVDIKYLSTRKGKTFILPFVVSNNEGCGFMTGWEREDYKPDKKLLIRQRDYNQSTNSVKDILNFNDGAALDLIDCILLKPIIMPVAVH